MPLIPSTPRLQILEMSPPSCPLAHRVQQDLQTQKINPVPFLGSAAEPPPRNAEVWRICSALEERPPLVYFVILISVQSVSRPCALSGAHRATVISKRVLQVSFKWNVQGNGTSNLHSTEC